MNWRCRYLPWHRIVSWRPVPGTALGGEIYKCRCGREVAVYHRAKVCVPWNSDTERDFKEIMRGGGRL